MHFALFPPVDIKISPISSLILAKKHVEVRSKTGDTHLGHVFTDSPEDSCTPTFPQLRPNKAHRLMNLPSRIANVGDSLPYGMADNAVIAINHQADNLILLGAKMAQVLHQSLAIPFCPVPGDGRKNILHTPQLPPGGD